MRRFAGVAVAALAATLLAEQPATASAMADRSCWVSASNKWGCNTASIWVGSGANPHFATLGIPPSAPDLPSDEQDPINSFVVIRNVNTGVELLRDVKFHGAEHNRWDVGWPPANYRAELHCPYGCAGAQLYFDN
ncbi:hypothetical protein QLQ12_46145 [Actinoplanes sp. NEAU-A12]|uniref:Uncharacterized protein n=1 Tax=Actinoplanes sandaracinus TaxID=3045177 RepID=A0ABT6X1S2_9ACTN|nr:hypothetical protein [Actinoplanes sandaracinus]MDI6105977.1 hypothetical protein [Actinoplanes sandaracinus]